MCNWTLSKQLVTRGVCVCVEGAVGLDPLLWSYRTLGLYMTGCKESLSTSDVLKGYLCTAKIDLGAKHIGTMYLWAVHGSENSSWFSSVSLETVLSFFPPALYFTACFSDFVILLNHTHLPTLQTHLKQMFQSVWNISPQQYFCSAFNVHTHTYWIMILSPKSNKKSKAIRNIVKRNNLKKIMPDLLI